MSEKLRESKSKFPLDGRDILLIAGLLLLSYGLYLVYFPASFLVPGLILVGISIFGVRR